MKNAIISVSDKDNIVGLTNFLINNDFTVYSTGGTYLTLIDKCIYNKNILKISDLTQFPEILNGRVKTLHPHIYAGLLADKSVETHKNEMDNLNLKYFDLVVCNLYPFDKEPCIENIDIGGVSLIRASSKNYKNVVVLSNPNQYHDFITKFNVNEELFGIDQETRKIYAIEGFNMTSKYDNMISNNFSQSSPEELVKLKYGMNPHQYDTQVTLVKPVNTNPFELINGVLGMINLIDVIHGWLTVKEVDDLLDLPAAISMKHTSLAGLAVGSNISKNTLNFFNLTDENENENITDVSIAFMKSRSGDPLSSFGDFICISREVDEFTAGLIKKEICDGIAAPSFTPEALEILKTKKNGKFIILKMSTDYYKTIIQSGWNESKEIYGIKLTQRNNSYRNDFNELNNEKLRIDYVLANTALKYAQSNNISMACDGQIIGMGCGQQNRVGCVKLAGDKSINWLARQSVDELNFWYNNKNNNKKRQEKVNLLYELIEDGDIKPDTKEEDYNIVMSSDGFFPFPDNITLANKYGVKHIIHPGGSIADEIIHSKCLEYGIGLYITNNRMFYH